MSDTILDKARLVFEPIEVAGALGKQVNVVVAAASILETLCTEQGPVRMTTLARRLHIPPSSCFNILRTLTREGLVSFKPKEKVYSVDLGLASIARNYLTPGGSLRVVGPLLEDFARLKEITLVIWRRAGHHMTVVTYFDDGAAVRVHIEPGSRFPLLSGAMGRVIAAFGGLSPRELKGYFSRVKWDTAIGFNEFTADVDVVARRGWACDPGIFNHGITTVSVPMDDGLQEHVDAVLSATMFVGQHGPEAIEEIARELQTFAKLLASVRLGRSF